jgi:hypothetical protein
MEQICHVLFNKTNILHYIHSLQFAIEIIYNIRSLKQLSVEKEVLRQYSESIDQVFMSVS